MENKIKEIFTKENLDEILDRILKATDELINKIPISVLAMIPKKNRVDFVSTLANTMIIGANIYAGVY